MNSELPIAWLILAAILGVILGILFVFGTIDERSACSIACRKASGYRFEAPNCECIP